MNKNKSLAFVSALLVSTSLSSAALAQTTVSGNIAIGLKGLSDQNTKVNSYRNMLKETQLNIRNAGKLSNGVDYVAGFSVEYDGTDTGTTAMHLENNYIDLVFGNTVLTLGSDHIMNPDADLANIVGGETDIDNVVTGIGNSVVARTVSSKQNFSKIHSRYEQMGIGVMQTLPGLGRASINYVPESSVGTSSGAETKTDLASSSNGQIEIGFVGDLGVKGLTTSLWYNNEGSKTPENVDRTGYKVAAKYQVGQIVPAIELMGGETEFGVQGDIRNFGLGFIASKQLTIGLNYAITKVTPVSKYNGGVSAVGTASVDEKQRGIAIGYNLGPMVIHTWVANVDNYQNVVGNKGKGALIKGTLSF